MEYRAGPRSRRVAAEVRAEMARQKVTGSSVAQAIGMSQPSLSRRLSGAKALTVEELEQVGAVLGLTIEDLWKRSGGEAA